MSRIAAASAAAGALFVLSWAGNSRTEEGNASFLGLEEGDWRALLNPALAVWLVGVWRVRGRFGPAGAAGAWAALAGLGAVLAGNVLEFGLLGEPFLAESPPASGSWSPGWAAVLVGAPVALAGALVVAGAAVRGRGAGEVAAR